MIDEKLMRDCLRMMRERSEYFKNLTDTDLFHVGMYVGMGSAYESAYTILSYALDGNEECLRQFDCYGEDK